MLSINQIETEGKTAAVLGTGGAAKAVVAYLLDHGVKRLCLVSRQAHKKPGFEQPGIEWMEYAALPSLKGDILVNCTPVGMYPNTGVSPVDRTVVERFEALVDLYAEQAGVLLSSGVDLFLVESVMAMAEARAAVLGIRKAGGDKPVLVTCYCDDEGRTPTGTDVLACAIVMQGMGVAAFGLNCVDPAVAEEQLTRLHLYTDMPLIAEPSAGLPETLSDGTPAYQDNAGEFAKRVPSWAAAGVRIFGGCCGTNPGHIRAMREALEQIDFSAFPPVAKDPDVIPCASEKEARFITPDVDVGETIECTPDLVEDILEAEEERPVGALRIAILEEDDLEIFAEEQYAIKDALCLWSDVPELMEGALRVYQGRAFYDGTGDLDRKELDRLSWTYGLIVL